MGFTETHVYCPWHILRPSLHTCCPHGAVMTSVATKTSQLLLRVTVPAAHCQVKWTKVKSVAVLSHQLRHPHPGDQPPCYLSSVHLSILGEVVPHIPMPAESRLLTSEVRNARWAYLGQEIATLYPHFTLSTSHTLTSSLPSTLPCFAEAGQWPRDRATLRISLGLGCTVGRYYRGKEGQESCSGTRRSNPAGNCHIQTYPSTEMAQEFLLYGPLLL